MDSQAALNRRAQVEEFQRRHHTKLVTMIFSDIVGSTKLKQILGDRAAIAAIQRHHALIREILSGFKEAEEVSTAGDAFFLVFAKPSDAVKFSLLAQAGLRRLAEETGHPVLDRIGIHVGEVWVDETAAPGKSKDLYGIQVDTCARVSSLGGPDQILLTRFVFDSARQVLKNEDVGGLAPLSWLNHGPYLMKGVEEPLDVCEVGETGKAMLSPPADTEKARHFVSPDGEPVLGWRPAVDQPVPGTSWVLEKKLGEGGFGEVWLGRDKILKTRHIFKFCFRADRVRSLKREVTLFRLLKERVGAHPNIVTVEATYFDEPPFYIVMQYVDGSDLPAWCEGQGGIEKIPLAARLEVVAQAAEALQAAHDSGVIHRDVKPSNILVGGEGGGIRVHLTDFGIGQVISQEALAGITRAGFTQTMAESSSSRSGTQLYMAPELFAGKAASIRSDIYALGVVLYQLLTGDFTRPVTTDWARQVSDPLLLEDLEKCFAGEPEERFAGAEQLADQLRSLERRRTALAEQQALIKSREQAAYRRGVMRTAAVAVAVVAAVASLAIFAFQQARRAKLSAKAEALQRNEAQEQAKKAEAATAQARENSSQSDFLQAIRSIHESRNDEAVAQLVRSLSADKTNMAALCRLTTLLTYESFPLLVFAHESEGNTHLAHFSPDGKSILSVSGNTVEVWNARSGEPLIKPLKFDEEVRLADFSPDGNRIVTASANTARIWSVQSGQPLTEPLKHDRPINSVQFSADGKRIVTACGARELRDDGSVRDDGSARVWDAQTGKPLTEPLMHDMAVTSAQFSPDGERIVTVSDDGTAQVWDARSGMPTIGLLKDAGAVCCAQFSPDGKRIVTGSAMHGDNYDPGYARVWDAQSGHPLTGPMTHAGGCLVSSAQFSPDGKLIVTLSFDSEFGDFTACVWNAENGKPATEPLKHEHFVTSAQFSPDGKRIVTVSDGTPRVWDARSGRLLMKPLRPGGGQAEFSPDGKQIVTASGRIRIWNVQNGSALCESFKADDTTNSVEFSPNRKMTLTVSDRTVCVRDSQSGNLVTRLEPDDLIDSAHFSPDGKRVVIASQDAEHFIAQVWNAQSGRPLTKPIKHDAMVNSAHFSPDGKRLVTAASDSMAHIWDAQSGEQVTEPLNHDDEVYSAEFSPDGRRIVTASVDRTARVWNAQTGKPLTEPLMHDSVVNSAQFSPDGRRIVTASMDGMARVWDAQSGQLLANPFKHPGIVWSAQFSSDGKRIVTEFEAPRSFDTYQLTWDIAPSGRTFPEWLPRLAVAIADKQLNDQGVFESSREEPVEVIKTLREQLSHEPDDDNWTNWGRWFLADRSTRTISPFSKITVPEYIENRINENTPESLDEAEHLALGNAEILWRIANARVQLETQKSRAATSPQ